MALVQGCSDPESLRWSPSLSVLQAHKVLQCKRRRSLRQTAFWSAEMNTTELLIRSIEQDLPHYHRNRMAELQGQQYAQLREERTKPTPDANRIAALKAAMIQTERNKQDASITEREVLKPLRERLAKEQPVTGKKPTVRGR